jgi:hypothetical protein
VISSRQLVISGYDAATLVKELYENKIEQKFESVKPERIREMARKRGSVEHVDCVGIYVLTLNKNNQVRHVVKVLVADAKSIDV